MSNIFKEYAEDLYVALQDLVKINEEHNKDIENIIGRPTNWNDCYLNRAREVLNRKDAVFGLNKKQKIAIGYFDGCSKNNPGEAGAGAYMVEKDTYDMIWQGYKYLGIMTNNEAEYNAILLLISVAKSKNISTMEIRGDSALVINQLSGAWKTKEPRIKVLKDKVQEISEGMNITYTWVPREENTLADQLSNTAVTKKGEMI